MIEPFLIDANKRAKEANKQAYVHAVGLGLGVWMVHHRQVMLCALREPPVAGCCRCSGPGCALDHPAAHAPVYSHR